MNDRPFVAGLDGRRALALVIALGLSMPAAGLAATVALIQSGPLTPYEQATAAFRTAYAEPVTAFTLDERDPDGLLRRVEAARPTVVVAVGLKAALFARDRLPRVPLVFCVVPNYERFDLSGGTITGVSADVPPERDLAALRSALPGVRRVGLLFGQASGATLAHRAHAAADAAGIILVEAPVKDLSDLQMVARDLAGRVDALWLPADPTVATPEVFRALLELSLAQRKPLLVFSESLVRSGALVAVSLDYAWMGSQAAGIVRRIQNGERAGDIGVMPLRRTRVVLNPATARALGCVVPSSADGGIEVLP
jgi:putative tryptophan/tyrosine transport system substrate-binding protein